MSLVNTLKQLKTNIFGGPGNTGFEKPPAYKTRIRMEENPTSFRHGRGWSTRTLHGVLCKCC